MGKRKLPFGYHVRDGQIQIKKNEAQVVRMIFDHYTAGMSYSSLTDKLNRQGIPYVPGKPWNKNMLARILQDERYMGGATYPQIITSESFQYAKAAKPDTSGTTDCAEIKDIRILARCGLCHGPMRRERKDRWQCPQCMDSSTSIKDGHLILCVDRLLRRLHEKTETAAPSPASPSNDEAVRRAQDDFTHELDNSRPCFSLLCRKTMVIMPERRRSHERQKTDRLQRHVCGVGRADGGEFAADGAVPRHWLCGQRQVGEGRRCSRRRISPMRLP